MLRSAVLSFSVLALGAFSVGAAHADTVRDTEHNFRISVPSGWDSKQNPSEEIRIAMAAPDREQTGANCNVVTEAHAPSKAMTQAQIDTDIDAQVTEAAWLAMFKAIIFIDNVVIEKAGSERLSDHVGHYVLATFSSVTPGMPVRLIKLKQYLVAIPGELFFITCSASQDAYAQKEDAFKGVFESFSPLNDVVASAAYKGVPSLTLYAQPNFGGVSRVVTQDTPDLGLSGWRDAASSISIGGTGPWQVCTGANYSGTCRLVSSTLHEKVTVASARRLPGSAFALMLQAGGAQGTRTAVSRK